MRAYLLYHSLAETASATISFGTFLFTWNTRRFQNAYLRSVGAGALFVGLFETLHCLAFPGMSVFAAYDANLSPQLWLSARLFQASASLLGLLLLLRREVRVRWLLGAFAAAFAVLCAAVFSRHLPDAVLPSGGLTPLKVAAEWALAVAFLGSVALLFRVRERFSAPVFGLLVAHGATMAACELCFTLYSRPHDLANFLGHLLLLAGGSLQYLAILRAGLIDPAATTFRDLTQARDRLERAQAAGRVGTFEWDLSTRGPVAVAGMEGVYGEAPEGLTGLLEAWKRRIHPDDLDRVERQLEEAIAGGGEYESEYRVLWHDGSVHWVSAHARVERDERGRPVRLVGANQEITARRRAEEALRESEEQYRLLFAANPNPMFVFDEETLRFLAVNDAAVQHYGWSREELLAMTVLDLRPEEDRAWAREVIQRHRGTREARVGEVRHRRKDGAVLDVEVAASTISVAGRVARLCSMSDVTERRLAEVRELEQRQRAERRAAELDAILDSLAEPLLVSDARGHLVRANPAFRRKLGAPEEWLGLDAADRPQRVRLQDADGLPEDPARTPGARALAGETVHGVLQRLPRPDGSVLHLATSSAPIRTASGIVGAVVVFTDVTERVRAEEALREADRSKNEFLAVLSHELRNPLAPVRNSLHVLERAAPGGEVARRAQGILRRQVDQMARLVDDLLDVTRITRNKIHLQRERLELGELVRRTVEDHRSLFDEAGVRLELEPAADPAFVDGDASRLAQVAGNLLQNAAKFTPRGGRVTVSVAAVSAARRVEIRVADTGVGMAPAVLARLFQPFVQADETLDRSQGGLGLGLALVKGLVDLHGGEVSARSEGLGKGAEFVVAVPAEGCGAGSARPGPGARPRRPRRVLVIEDNVDAAESLRDALELDGHHVVVAHCGPEGLERARQLRPEAVLCDIGLPGMDGYEVARAFRSDRALDDTYLVALSGYALPEDQRRATEAGFDRHLAKPPSLDELLALIANPGRRERARSTADRVALST